MLLIDILKKLYEKKKINVLDELSDLKYDKVNLEEIEIGSIIWAKRYNDEDKMETIPEGHREGPYIVIEKKEDKQFMCLYCSGVEKKKDIYQNKRILLTNYNHILDKDTYIYINRYQILDPNRIIKIMGKLTTEDLKYLSKSKEISKREMNHYKDTHIIPKIPIEIGDIVTLTGIELYLIIDENDKNYYYIELSEKNKGSNEKIKLNETIYYLNLDTVKTIDKCYEPIRYDYIKLKQLKNILVMLEQRQNYLDEKKSLNRGSLIKLDNKLYYIYGEIGDEWMAFLLTTKGNNEELCKIIIDRKKYYTDFTNNIQFSKKQSNIEIISKATDEEIDTIKIQKKSYKKNQENKKNKTQQQLKKEEIQPGSLVELNYSFTKQLYVVIIRNQESLIVIKYEDLNQNKYNLKKLYIDEVNKIDEIENFDLKPILINIKNKTYGFVSQNKLKKLIKELN